jgi:hypothetical protein
MVNNTTLVLAISLVLFLVALPLTSFGAMEENQVIWGAGLALLVVAGILPPATRFIGGDDGDDKDTDKDEDEAKADGGQDGGSKQDDPDRDARRADRGRDGDATADGRTRAGTPGTPGTLDAPPPHPRSIEPPPSTEDRRTMRPRVEEQRDRADGGGQKRRDRKGDDR